ncbi:pyruvate dehydrogenase (acetyl-transferring) E1 component subunit alpha [Planomicrobium sp. YIM 101495]|uniref:pyruvate dehydrogenase (acetyl-transferring) E1 component subunit alpha n=1 Tax=Planomicrobium sp. YIM 101495 TaxID=2665160 RepID=UPI0012B9B3C6|nr:pyruvate dehydrogenase (acetyl-transferring) E1 component subunit alpha [Planomicrobium sp. YIM 101495]MTD30720.1 pyruvate dehydrogenase (acetyl-transferring) E1 component subunit alpha [Planomicrobium sp. YIM 101495]
MWMDQSQLDFQKVTYIDEQGKALKEEMPVEEAELVSMYEWMVRARVFDQRAVKLQRQGRIGTYAPLQGQEAAQIGSAFAMRENDWVYPSYREIGVSMVRGVPMSQFLLYAMGHLKGLAQEQANVFPVQIIIGAQFLHAVGGAWASQYKGEESVSVAYIGDGGTSEGDFHEALNFAGVYKLPIIFFVQNNQWAISVPVSKQTASRTIAQKALAYGITGVRVDGNDAVAVYTVMKEAIAKAQAGEPVLIEAETFRQGPHTTADDPTKYRMADDEKTWTAKDPLVRLKTYLTEQRIWDEEKDRALYEQADAEVSEAFQAASSAPASELKDVFEHVYETKTAQLSEQQAQVEEASRQ